MNAGHLLLLFLPDRLMPGTLTTVLRKYPVQYVVGCAEPGVRERYADLRGVVLTVVDGHHRDRGERQYHHAQREGGASKKERFYWPPRAAGPPVAAFIAVGL